jgi:hypothetical protein
VGADGSQGRGVGVAGAGSEREGGEAPVGLLLYLVFYALLAYAIVDIARTPRREIRVLSKPIWIVIALLLPPLGGALWFIFGRPRSAVRRRRGTAARRDHPAYGGRFEPVAADDFTASGPPRLRRRAEEPGLPLGPDDDPEFLLELAERLRRQHPDGPASHP